MRNYAIILLILLCTLNVLDAEASTELTDIIENQVESIDFREIDKEMENIYQEYPIPKITLESIINLLKGESELSFDNAFTTLSNFLLRELKQQVQVFIRIVILTLLGVLIIKVQSAFNSNVSEIVFKIIYLTLMVFIVQSLTIALQTASQAVNQMINFMIAMWPVLLTLMVSLGHVVSSSMFDPLLVGGCHLVSQIINFTVLPLFFGAGTLQIVDYLSEEISISRLANLIKSFGSFILGICFTLFVGLTIVRGTAGSVADGVALRTGKFLAKGFLPVVGSMLSDAFDTVLGCSLIVKNAVGVFGLLVLFFICVLPALKLVAMILMYKVAGACLQPLDNDRISPVLYATANILTYIMAAILTVGVMLFITVTAILISGNATVMFR